MSKKATALTVTAGSKPRLLFTVEERPASFDLTIIIRHATHGMLPDAHGTLTAHEIVEQHISVHNSAKSPTQINAIKITTTINSNRMPPTEHYTLAMKQHSHFAPLFTQRCCNLKHDRFLYNKASQRLVSLGEYDPDRFQLIYMILVSNLQTDKLLDGHRTNCIHVDFTTFRITVLWSFLSLASDALAMSLLLGTTKPEEMHLVEDEKLRYLTGLLPHGFPPLTCIPQYINLRLLFKQQYISASLERYRKAANPPSQEELERHAKLLNITGEFFKEGNVNKVVYRQHMRRVERTLRDDPLFFNDLLFRSTFNL